jgi:predicted nucleotidyltransferase
MGTQSNQPGLGDALFTKTQQRVLGLLFGAPDRSFYANEIVRAAGVGTGAVARELAKLHRVGLVTVRRIGNQKHYQANADAPIFEPLREIVRKTFGLADVLRSALEPLAPRIDAAFVFGSVASGTDTAASDVDVFLLTEALTYADVMPVLAPVESTLGRTVNPTLYTPAELRTKLDHGNAFLRRVLDQPKIFLIGSARDLGIREPGTPGPDR